MSPADGWLNAPIRNLTATINRGSSMLVARPPLLRRDPTADVLGTVQEDSTCRFGSREKSHGVPIDQHDVYQVEHDASSGLARQECLQSGHMILVHFAAQRENNFVRARRAVNSVRHLVLHYPQHSKVCASGKR